MTTRAPLLALLALALAVLAPTPAAAAPGDLDTSFDSDGTVTTPVGGGAIATSVAQQADGKLVVGGYTGGFSGGDFLITRYNANGSADMSFNGGSPRIVPVGSSQEFGVETAVLRDGKILQVGTVDVAIGGWFGIVRYDADGSIDSGFDGDGAVTTEWSGYDHVSVRGVAVDDKGTADTGDDQYVVVGDGTDQASSLRRMLMARYNADGQLDPGFGMGGKTTTAFGGAAFAADVVLQSGKVVVGGHESTGPGTANMAIVRLNSNGATDSTFEHGGKYSHPIGSASVESFDFVAQPDGRLLLSAQVENGGSVGIARYSADGALDASFDGDGMVITPLTGIAYAMPYELRVQTDGKVLVGGTAVASGSFKHHFVLARYTTAGALDPAFSGDGITLEGPGENAYGQALALQADGKPVLAGAITPSGGASDGTANDLALLRLQGDAPPTPEPDPDPEPSTPKPLANTARPVVIGSLYRTSTLTAWKGGWQGNPTTFRYEWEACATVTVKKKRSYVCGPAPGSKNEATYYLPKKKEPQLDGMAIRVTVTATAGAKSIAAVSDYRAKISGRFTMPPFLPVKSGSKWRFTTLEQFINRIEAAGGCFYAQDPGFCGNRFPVKPNFQKQKLTDVRPEQRDEIKPADIYGSNRDEGEFISSGEQVKVFFYDPNRDPPEGTCTFLKKGTDINEIKQKLGTDVGDARKLLDKQKCKYGVDFKDNIGGSKEFILDVERSKDYKMLTLRVSRPDPCRYLAMSGDEIIRTLGEDPHSADEKVEKATCKSTKTSNGLNRKIKKDRTTRVKVDQGSRRITFFYDEAPSCPYLDRDTQDVFGSMGTNDPAKVQAKLEDEGCKFRVAEEEYEGFFEPFVQQISRQGDTYVVHVGIPKKLECQQEVRFGPFYARGTCLKRVGMTWEASGDVLFAGLKLVPNSASTKIVIDPLNLRIAATGKARVVTNPTTLFGKTYGPYVLYEGEFNWVFQGAANWDLNNALMGWLRDRLPGGGAPQNQANGGWPLPVVRLPDLGSIPGMPKLSLPGLGNLPNGVGLPDFSKIQFPKELGKFPGVDAGKLQFPTFNAPKVEFPAGLIPDIKVPPMCFNTGEDFKLAGMGFAGKACLELSGEGARLTGNVKLEFAGGATAAASMLIKPDATVVVEDISTGIGEFKIGPVTVGPATLRYIAKENRWHGEGSGSFSGGPVPIGGSVSFDVVNGGLANGMLEVKSTALGYPIGATGLFLVGAGVEYNTYPTTSIGGSMTVSLGPVIPGGFRLIAVRVAANYDFGPPRVLTLDGQMTLLNKFKVANANLNWNFDTGVVTFGSDVVFKFETEGLFGVGKATYSIEGHNRGTVYDGQFQLDGYSLVNLNGPKIQAESTINNWGFAACASAEAKGKITIGNFDVNWDFRASGGVAYSWPDGTNKLGVIGTFGGGSCGLDDYRTLPNQLQPGARAAANERSFFIGKNLSQTSLAFRGNGNAPKVILRSPSGKTYTTPSDLRPVSEPGHVILQQPGEQVTTVLLANPEPGRWRVSTPAGSPEVIDAKYANPLPDIDVKAKVSGSGYARTLSYDVAPIPGQKVTFVERGRGAAELIGTAKGRTGKLRFRPGPGPKGKRSVFAIVTQDDLPRDELKVGSYSAPAPFRPGAPKGLRVSRTRANAKVSWNRVQGATEYRAVAVYNDGAKRILVTRKPSFRLARVLTSETVSVSVTAVSAEGRSGPAAKAKAAAKKPKKPRPRKRRKG